MATDFTIDTATGDLVDSDDGWFAEDETAGAAVFCQLTQKLDAWPGDPDAGHLLDRALELGEAPDVEGFLVTEAERALRVLAADGMITDVEATTERDGEGRIVLRTRHRDRTSGQIVDRYVDPYGG